MSQVPSHDLKYCKITVIMNKAQFYKKRIKCITTIACGQVMGTGNQIGVTLDS